MIGLLVSALLGRSATGGWSVNNGVAWNLVSGLLVQDRYLVVSGFGCPWLRGLVCGWLVVGGSYYYVPAV